MCNLSTPKYDYLFLNTLIHSNMILLYRLVITNIHLYIIFTFVTFITFTIHFNDIIYFIAPQAPPQSSYGNNWNWNMPQNGPAAATGPPGQTGPGPQSKLPLIYVLLK